MNPLRSVAQPALSPLVARLPSAATLPEEVESAPDTLLLSGLDAIAREQRPGVLWVVDQYGPPPSLGVPGPFAVVEHFVSHGHKVIAAARESGFAGPVRALEINDDLDQLPFADELLRQQQLWQSDRPEDLKESLRIYVLVQRKMALHDSSKKLEQLCQAGVRQSVVNLSLGTSQAESVQGLLSQVLEGDAQTKVKFVQAFGLDVARLSNPDTAVAGAERVRFHQQMFALVAGVEQDAGFLREKQRYDDNVARFESAHNSVVVAATNSGQLAELLQQHALGMPSSVPVGAYRNDLSNERTTTVGAAHQEQVAAYSADDPGVAIYAQGQLELQGEHYSGTSLAAPRVAAAMAQLHKQRPELTSEAVEQALKQRLTALLGKSQGQSSAPLLD